MLKLKFNLSFEQRFRSYALACTNHFINSRNQILLTFVDDFLRCLFSLAEDIDATVRKHVCSAFVQLLEAHLDRLLPHLPNIIEVCSSTQQLFSCFNSLCFCERRMQTKISPGKLVNFGSPFRNNQFAIKHCVLTLSGSSQCWFAA